jgi:hypothetical protein
MIVCAREEESRTQAEIRQPVSMRVRNALNDAMQAQSPEVVRHRSGLQLIRSKPEQRREILAAMNRKSVRRGIAPARCGHRI